MAFKLALLSSLAFLLSGVHGQLSGRVGPTTPLSEKRQTICNVLDYGGSVGSSDIGPAIGKAFSDCVKTHTDGATLYVPPGNYNMRTWQTLKGGTKWAFQLDGIITRTNTAGGNMIVIDSANDFEFYSSNSAGAIQGNGYQVRNTGPRLIRMVKSNNYSVHDLILVDAPVFHLVIQEGTNGEIYNMVIRGADIGGSDGIDIWGWNYWIHDIEVSNRDECVTVKSPASNILVERIWCNQSGGSAIGSLGSGTAIENVLYRNIYTNGGNQIFMIKSNGGSGYVRNVIFQDFISRNTAYGLNVDQYWGKQSTADGSGVQLNNITFRNWDGAVVNGVQRSPIQFLCADGAPCTNMKLDNVKLWSNTNSATNKCQSAFGSGGSCLRSGTPTKYNTVTITVSKPSGYTDPPSLSGDLSEGFAQDQPIPIPKIPTVFYPGLPQISPLAKNK